MTDLVKRVRELEEHIKNAYANSAEMLKIKDARIEQLENEITNLAGDILMVKVLRERIKELESEIEALRPRGLLAGNVYDEQKARINQLEKLLSDLISDAGHDIERIKELESRLWQYEELARNTIADGWSREPIREAAKTLLALGELGKWHD